VGATEVRLFESQTVEEFPPCCS